MKVDETRYPLREVAKVFLRKRRPEQTSSFLLTFAIHGDGVGKMSGADYPSNQTFEFFD